MAKAKKSGKAATKPQGGGAGPMIDTNAAAAAAARMLMAKKTSATVGGEGKAESTTFRKMKESLHKPHLRGMESQLNSGANPSAKPMHGPGGRQVSHNQTFGADVNRTGVPRRTGG